jgi:hypothetical protein
MLQDNRLVFFILDKSCILCTSLGKQNSHKNSVTKNGVGENLDPFWIPFNYYGTKKINNNLISSKRLTLLDKKEQKE